MEVKGIFVHLPVKNLDKSMEFFTQLGFEFNAEFTNESAASMVMSDHIYVMFLTEDRFKSFTNKEISDASTATETILAFSLDSKEKVDEIIDKVKEAGGKPANGPQDYGFMYSWSFEDLDGHHWEFFFMDENRS